MYIMAISFIFFTIIIYGFYFSNKSVYKLKDYKQLKKAMLILEAEINFGNETLSNATRKISKKINKPFSKIFNEFSNKLDEEIYTDINVLWENSIQLYRKNLYFTENEIDEIKSLGKVLDSGDITLQLKNIKVLIQYLDKEINELQTNSFKEAKVYKTISVLVSLLVVILLI